MNILLLVTSLIFIFSFGAYALFQERIATYWEERSYSGNLRAQRELHNALEEHLFKKAPEKKTDGKTQTTPSEPHQPKAEPTSESEKKKTTLNKREKKNLTDINRLNIYPLLSSSVPTPLLYETTATLIRLLYQHASFYQAKLEYQLLDALIKKAHESPSYHELSDLFPQDKPFDPIFYKILKGTHNYDLEKAMGYPALSDYFIIEEAKERKPVNFHFAPKVMLQALFGNRITDDIIQEEIQKKSKPLTQSELELLLLKYPELRLNLVDFTNILSFTTKKPKTKAFIVTDEDTGIQLKEVFLKSNNSTPPPPPPPEPPSAPAKPKAPAPPKRPGQPQHARPAHPYPKEA